MIIHMVRLLKPKSFLMFNFRMTKTMLFKFRFQLASWIWSISIWRQKYKTQPLARQTNFPFIKLSQWGAANFLIMVSRSRSCALIKGPKDIKLSSLERTEKYWPIRKLKSLGVYPIAFRNKSQANVWNSRKIAMT